MKTETGIYDFEKHERGYNKRLEKIRRQSRQFAKTGTYLPIKPLLKPKP